MPTDCRTHSVNDVPETEVVAVEGDLRAHIRDAAIEQIGLRGFRAPLRTIAEAADVSPQVLLDLYGSRENLLRACDDHIVDAIRASKSAALQSHSSKSWLSALAEIDSYAPMMAYLVKSMESGGRPTHELLDRMIDNAVRYLEDGVRSGTIKPSRDPKARATFLALNNAGGFMLYLHRHPTPTDVAAVLRDYARDMIMPALELYTDGLLADPAIMSDLIARQNSTPST